jgi:hypothetical protein
MSHSNSKVWLLSGALSFITAVACGGDPHVNTSPSDNFGGSAGVDGSGGSSGSSGGKKGDGVDVGGDDSKGGKG